MFARAAVAAVVVMLCMGISADVVSAGDISRTYVELSFSVRDPYRDTTGTTAVRDPYRDTTFVSRSDGGVDTCVGGLPMTFALYETEEATEWLWKEELSCVPIDETDYVNVLLGQTTALSSDVVTRYDALYLELTISGDVIEPRLLVIFSEHVLMMNAVGSSPAPTEEQPASGDSADVVYSAGQRSLGAVGFGSDPTRPRLVLFGNSPLTGAGRVNASQLQTLVAQQLLQNQKTIVGLRRELARLKEAAGEMR